MPQYYHPSDHEYSHNTLRTFKRHLAEEFPDRDLHNVHLSTIGKHINLIVDAMANRKILITRIDLRSIYSERYTSSPLFMQTTPFEKGVTFTNLVEEKTKFTTLPGNIRCVDPENNSLIKKALFLSIKEIILDPIDDINPAIIHRAYYAA